MLPVRGRGNWQQPSPVVASCRQCRQVARSPVSHQLPPVVAKLSPVVASGHQWLSGHQHRHSWIMCVGQWSAGAHFTSLRVKVKVKASSKLFFGVRCLRLLWSAKVVFGTMRLGTLGARPPSPPHQVSAKESKVEKHEPKNKKRYARSQLSTRRCDYMMHGQGVSSLRLGTLGARPPSPPHQVSAKESKVEKHEPKNKKRYARLQLSTRRRDYKMHG